MNLAVRPVFSITSHISGKTYEVIQTDQEGGQSGQGVQVLQIATNDAQYANAQIPNKFTEFIIDQQNPSNTYKDAIMELCLAVQRGIESNTLDAAAVEWSNTVQSNTSGLTLSRQQQNNQGYNQNNPNNPNNLNNLNQGNAQTATRRQQQQRHNQNNQNLQVRELVTN